MGHLVLPVLLVHQALQDVKEGLQVHLDQTDQKDRRVLVDHRDPMETLDQRDIKDHQDHPAHLVMPSRASFTEAKRMISTSRRLKRYNVYVRILYVAKMLIYEYTSTL